MFSSHQQYCVQFLVPLFNRDVDKLSPEKEDQNCKISRSRIRKIDKNVEEELGLRSS